MTETMERRREFTNDEMRDAFGIHGERYFREFRRFAREEHRNGEITLPQLAAIGLVSRVPSGRERIYNTFALTVEAACETGLVTVGAPDWEAFFKGLAELLKVLLPMILPLLIG